MIMSFLFGSYLHWWISLIQNMKTRSDQQEFSNWLINIWVFWEDWSKDRLVLLSGFAAISERWIRPEGRLQRTICPLLTMCKCKWYNESKSYPSFGHPTFHFCNCKMMTLALLPPATKLRQGNVFTSVCQEFCPRGGVCHTPRQTPPWADTPCPVLAGIHPSPTQCMLGYTHPLPSACWDTPPPPCAVHAGIRSTSERYASYWNVFLLNIAVNDLDANNYSYSNGVFVLTEYITSGT